MWNHAVPASRITPSGVRDRTRKPLPAMMKFKIGETIIEPTNGICTMRGMRRMTVDGQEMTVYIFDAQNAKVFVPADQVEKRNIRRPMSREDVKKVLAALKQPVSPDRGDARMQYTNYREVMKSGDPMKITRLLRDLFILDEADDLKGKEKEIMEQAKKFLCDEIAFVRNVSKIQVTETVNEALRQMYKKKVARDKERAKKSGVGLPMELLGYGATDDDEPLIDDEADTLGEDTMPRKKAAKKKSVLEDDDEEIAEDAEVESDEEETPKPKKAAAKAKPAKPAPKKKKKADEDEEEPEDEPELEEEEEAFDDEDEDGDDDGDDDEDEEV